jgi:hypothetical protein
MFFTVKKKSAIIEDFTKTNMYLNACFVIKHYPFRAAEIGLDIFLKQKYKIGLRDACFLLLMRITAGKATSGDLILTFNNPDDDAMARLITYGNGIIPGSNILLLALNQ